MTGKGEPASAPDAAPAASAVETAPDMTPALVEALRAGDAKAGRVLADTYRVAIVRFCRGYLGSIEDAEDAAQDIFYKVIAARDVPGHFRAWLYRIARNHCLNLVRNRHRRRDHAALAAGDDVDAELTGQLTRMLRVEMGARVKEALALLPDSTAEALRMRYVEGLSRQEIADVLDLRESVVKSRLFEGLKIVRTRLVELQAPGASTDAT
ncbi:MAG: RNA polymerase sigma factor [Phycisphaerales bacterium]|nr:RNA polymerase sigma factor [Phycisphaerales bacterium]